MKKGHFGKINTILIERENDSKSAKVCRNFVTSIGFPQPEPIGILSLHMEGH